MKSAATAPASAKPTAADGDPFPALNSGLAHPPASEVLGRRDGRHAFAGVRLHVEARLAADGLIPAGAGSKLAASESHPYVSGSAGHH